MAEVPLRAAVVVASNRAAAGVYDDTTGPLIVGTLSESGWEVDPAVVVPDGEAVADGGAAALAGDPEGVMMLSKALDHLARASKTNVDFIAAAEARAAAKAKSEAATVAESVARERGISADTIEAIKRGIFGVQA